MKRSKKGGVYKPTKSFKKGGFTNPNKNLQKKEQISKNQKEILDMLTNQFLTPNQIANRRQITRQSVYKTIRKLKKRGLLSGLNKGVYRGGLQIRGVVAPKNELVNPQKKVIKQEIRLHFLQIHCSIIYKSQKYSHTLNKCNMIHFGDTKVFLYRDVIEIFLSEDFYGEDENRCLAMASQRVNKIEARLENDLGVVLMKPRLTNHKIVNWHFSDTNNVLAHDLNEKKKRLAIYSRDDGKLWLFVDNSKPDGIGLDECETLHPETAKGDMGYLRDFFNNLRDKYAFRMFFDDLGKNPTKLSDLKLHLESVIDNRFMRIEQRVDKELTLMWQHLMDSQNNGIEHTRRLN